MSGGRSLLIVTAVALLSARPAGAWHAAGHEAVAAIAWRDLDAGTRARVTALLKQHHDFQNISAGDIMTSGLEEGEFLFMRAAIWPDDIRDDNHPSRFFHVRDWHFKDKAFNPSGNTAFKLHANSDDALEILTLANRVVPNPNAATPSRTVALCWLFHLVGDVHQPLHATTLLSADFPEGDAGGNSFFIKTSSGSGATNLHSFWDGLFDSNEEFSKADMLAAGVMGQHPRSGLTELGSHIKFSTWMDESFDLAKANAYTFKPAGHPKITLSPGVKKHNSFVKQPSVVPTGYTDNAVQVARKRLALAGYRLADRLREQFPAP
jgi:S1/P1 nuclease